MDPVDGDPRRGRGPRQSNELRIDTDFRQTFGPVCHWVQMPRPALGSDLNPEDERACSLFKPYQFLGYA